MAESRPGADRSCGLLQQRNGAVFAHAQPVRRLSMREIAGLKWRLANVEARACAPGRASSRLLGSRLLRACDRLYRF